MNNKELIPEIFAEDKKEEQLELLRLLGKIPAPSRKEDQRAVFCREWFIRQGAEDVCIDEAKNVICRIAGEDSRQWIVFQAHTDIVFPDEEELPMDEDEEKIYAPGIGDDTANLVNLMMAAQWIIKNKPSLKYGFLIVANACEEGIGNLDGTRALFEKYGDEIRAFYSFDGYLPQCCSRAVGSYRYRISCSCEGGHSYIDFGKKNAIVSMCAFVAELYRIVPPKQDKTTYNVGRIEGGTTVNSIAQEASILFEFRSESQQCLEKMNALLWEKIAEADSKEAHFELELLGVRPGNGDCNEEQLKAFTEKSATIINRYYHGPLDFGEYSTDANIPLSMNILANTIGTVEGGMAHTREEWIRKSSMKTGLEIVMTLMLQYIK